MDARIHQFVQEWGCVDMESCYRIERIIGSAFKMVRDSLPLVDLKLFQRSLDEMRYAATVFASYRDKRKICVFGSARTLPDEPEAVAAAEFGQKMRERGFMIITGGGDGIMGAAQRGAGAADSFGLNIQLPFEQRANDTIFGDPKLVNFNYFFTRKLSFVKESQGIALFPGGFGTMDEGFEVLTLMQTGKTTLMPFVLVDKPGGTYWNTWMQFLREHLLRLKLISPDEFHLVKVTHSVDEAVEEIAGFFKVFRSYRWLRVEKATRLIIRLERPLTEKSLRSLNSEFGDLLESGAIEQVPNALAEELDNGDSAGLPRLVFTPQRKNFGRLRDMIRTINCCDTE